MTVVAEISAALAGSMALLRGERDAMRHFDVSISGFWRSFRVALILAPVLGLDHLVDRVLRVADASAEPDLGPAFLGRVLNYVVGYTVLPLVLAALAGPLGMQRTYVPFILARNWTNLVGILPLLLASLALVVGLYGPSAYAVASIGALAFNLFYAYRVALIAAEVTPGQAVGLVALDVILMLIANTLIGRII